MRKRAFTLIELLVVIAIIGLLSSIVLVSLKGARAKARDTIRLSHMHQILLALQMYYDKYGKYPGPTSDYGECESACGCADTSTIDNDGDGNPFIEPLVDEGLMAKVPTDPIGGGNCFDPAHTYFYTYFRYGPGTYGCDPSRGSYFVLGIRDMETIDRPPPHPQSPGWSCPEADFQNDFDWVIGGFEK